LARHLTVKAPRRVKLNVTTDIVVGQDSEAAIDGGTAGIANEG